MSARQATNNRGHFCYLSHLKCDVIKKCPPVIGAYWKLLVEGLIKKIFPWKKSRNNSGTINLWAVGLKMKISSLARALATLAFP